MASGSVAPKKRPKKRRRKKKRERKAPVGFIGHTDKDQLKIDWQTPGYLLDAVRAYFGGAIPFDGATAADNPCGALSFCSPVPLQEGITNGGEHVSSDGLSHDWPQQVWINPPYGKATRVWLPKMRDSAPGREMVGLLSCSRWEQDYFMTMYAQANAVCFIRKRVKFINPATGDAVGGNTYANMFIGWGVHLRLWRLAFKDIGQCIGLTPL